MMPSWAVLVAVLVASMATTLMERSPRWVAQWLEQMVDPELKIARPRQIYTGHAKRDFIALEDRAATAG